jgi:hypothetical protein
VKPALVIAAVALALFPGAAAATQRVATIRGSLVAAPELVGSKVAWQEQRCRSGCGDLPIDCLAGGTTFDYAVRIGSPVRKLFGRRLRCSSSGPVISSEGIGASVSPTRLATVYRQSGGDDVGPPPVTATLSAGPPGQLAQLYHCDTGETTTFGSFEFALDGDAIAYDSDACGESRRYVVRDLASGEVHPVPQPALSSIYSPRLAGRYFAFLRSPFRLVVHDWQAGAQAYGLVLPETRYPQSLDVDGAGRAAVLTRDPDESTNSCVSDRISWLSPSEPRLHELPGRPCGTAVRIGADNVLFETGRGGHRTLQVTALDGSSPRTLARFGGVRSFGFDSDGLHAAYALRTCGGGIAIYRESVSERAFSAGSRRCPLSIRSTRLRSSHGTARLTLSCPRACTGLARLLRGRGVLASKAFGSERRGRKVLPLRLTSRARALLRRRGSIAVKVSVKVTDRDLRERTVRKSVRLGG